MYMDVDMEKDLIYYIYYRSGVLNTFYKLNIASMKSLEELYWLAMDKMELEQCVMSNYNVL